MKVRLLAGNVAALTVAVHVPCPTYFSPLSLFLPLPVCLLCFSVRFPNADITSSTTFSTLIFLFLLIGVTVVIPVLNLQFFLHVRTYFFLTCTCTCLLLVSSVVWSLDTFAFWTCVYRSRVIISVLTNLPHPLVFSADRSKRSSSLGFTPA